MHKQSYSLIQVMASSREEDTMMIVESQTDLLVTETDVSGRTFHDTKYFVM